MVRGVLSLCVRVLPLLRRILQSRWWVRVLWKGIRHAEIRHGAFVRRITKRLCDADRRKPGFADAGRTYRNGKGDSDEWKIDSTRSRGLRRTVGTRAGGDEDVTAESVRDAGTFGPSGKQPGEVGRERLFISVRSLGALRRW